MAVYQRSMLSKTLGSALVLIALLMLISDPAGAITQQTANPKEKADALISLLAKANNTVVTLFQRFKTNSMPVPQESLNEYDQTMDLAKETESLYRIGNYSEASSKTIQALQKLKEIISGLFENSILEQSDVERELEKATVLNSTIKRYRDQLQTIEELLKKPSYTSFNASSLNTQIGNAKSLLNNASDYVVQKNFVAASACITQVTASVKQITAILNDWTSELKATRLETYINQTEARLTALRTEAPTVANNLFSTSLQQAETSIDLAKEYLAQNLYNQTVTELINARESEVQAIQALKPYASTSDSIAGTANLNTTRPTNIASSSLACP